jgi:hypothetical protein
MKPHPIRSLAARLAVAVCLWVAVPSAQAAKEAFVRSKPHVNIGTIGLVDATAQFPGDASHPDFMWDPRRMVAQARIFPGGEAVGNIYVGQPDPEATQGSPLVLQVFAGEAEVTGNQVNSVVLRAVARSGAWANQEFVVHAQPARDGREDVVVWDLLGEEVHLRIYSTSSFLELAIPPPKADPR